MQKCEARLKYARIVHDGEEDRDEEVVLDACVYARIVHDDEEDRDEEVVLDACVFPRRIVSSAALRRGVGQNMMCEEGSCDKRNIVVVEDDTIHVLCDTVSFQTVRQRVVRAGLRVVCDWSDQCPRPKVCCSQTLVSHDSSKNSSFALDA